MFPLVCVLLLISGGGRSWGRTAFSTSVNLSEVGGTPHISGSVSLDEWRKGWADGLMTQVLVKEHNKKEKTEGGRLAGRREGGVTALTLATAARMAALSQQTGAGGDKKKSKSGKGLGKGMSKKKVD